jgi:hypothetical protein|tara:strand:+ start:51 stop:173 length:123 start_codon:yes stop_codon:yes gene_type:complete
MSENDKKLLSLLKDTNYCKFLEYIEYIPKVIKNNVNEKDY